MPRQTIAISVALLALLGASFLVVRLQRTSHYRVRFGDRTARIDAIRELSHKPKPQALGSLIVALDDEDANVRALAVRALTDLRATEALTLFQRLAQTDEDTEVRSTAAASLGEIPAADSVPVLLKALPDRSANVRACAATALGKLNATDADYELIGRLADESEAVREAAVDALGRLRSKAAVPKLAELLDAEDEVPVSRIQEALIAIVGKNLGIDPKPWQAWYLKRHIGPSLP